MIDAINFRSIEAFKNINESNVNFLKQNSKLYKYAIGYPISENKNIPEQVLIIISGEVRFALTADLKSNAFRKLNKDAFIGLSSLLRVKSCELISASTDVIAIAIPDKIILKLYKEEKSFKDWCDSHIQIPEAYEIANNIQNKSPNNKLNINNLVDIILDNSKIKTIENNNIFYKDSNFIDIVVSGNIINKEIGDLIYSEEKIETRGPFPARFISISKHIYDDLNNLNIENQNLNQTIDIEKVNEETIENNPGLIKVSAEKIGQYGNDKEFKIIRAKGLLRETLACLQMLANELNTPYRSDSVEKILRDALNRGQKPSIQLIGGITSMMGLYTTTAKINPNDAHRLPTPSLISWKDSFAIVKESNSKTLELISPKEGLIKIKPEQFGKSFSKGFIELLRTEKNEQTPDSKFGINWLLPSINRYRGVLIQVLIASFVVQLFGLANPLMIQVIIDKVISQRSLDTLQVLGVALVVVTILGGILSSLRTFLFNETTNRIDTRLGAEVIDHLLRLPLNYFDRRPVGELGSRIAELEKIRNFLTGQALTTILDAAFSLIYIVVMVIYSWLLTLIALAVVPIQILITVIGAPLIRRQIREIAEENAQTQSHLVEVLTGIQTVKAQNIERVSRWKWQGLYGKYISKSFQKTITSTALGETSQVLQKLSQLIVLWVGAILVLKGQLSLGQLIAFRIISGYVTQPLLRLSTIWQNIQELRVSFERLADIIDTPQEANELDKSKIPLPSIKGTVEFENLSFRFQNNQPDILNNINLQVNAGKFVGIVGQSGSGKSTLMKLLPRLYKAQSGKLMIDGYDVTKVELYSLRRQIGIVPQEPLLFKGSVSENIALNDPESESDEIVKVAKIADAHDFIMELKDGYSTNVGERGAGLSGGQKQRIAIARTLLTNPKLLILDEATSALDYQTERKVCEGLRNACLNSTVFFITHRLNTVRNADLIVMLHKGSIEEIGTHKELMNLKGRYYALYRQQEAS
tara:strand:- start:1388 stop:4336 length:2949 start_codon:yes stop_codon:yes gene_type:complete